METLAFARTKIQVPRPRPGQLARPRIEGPLRLALEEQRLVLLAAPAGFGKTSLLARQLAQLGEAAALAWIGCDAEDDLPRLAGCLVAALDPFDLPWRTSPEALVGALNGEAEPRAKLTSELVNALLASERPRGLIVFEDLHRIEDREAFAWLDSLIERLPHSWGLVLSSRYDPPLALARRRVRGELAEFRQEELRFNAEEVRGLLALREVEDENAEDLLERTDGWPAGLGLLLARHGRGASRHEQHLYDYLSSEVLDEMPAELREFLIRTSVLPELSASACAAVSGNARAAQLLEELERRSLFVTVLDAEERTLRLHDLLRAALDERLRRDHAEELPALLQRAALVETDPTRRIAHLVRGEHWALAAEQALEQTRELLTHGALGAAQRLFDGFPPEQLERQPALLLAQSVAAWARWEWPTVERFAGRAVRAYEAQGRQDQAMRARSYWCLGLSGTGQDERAHRELDLLLAEPCEDDTLCRALLSSTWLALYDGELERVAGFWEQMLDALERSGDLALWYECSPTPPLIGLPGMRAPLQRYVRSALQRLPDAPTPLRGICHVTEARLRLWAGDMAGAMSSLRAADGDARWLGLPVNLHVHLRLLQSLIHALLGQGAAAVAMAGALAEEASHSSRRAQLGALALHALRVGVLAGDLDSVRKMALWLEQLEAPARNWPRPRQMLLGEAHLARMEGDQARACELWVQVLDGAERIDTHGLVTEARLRLAEGLLELGRLDEAAAALRPLLERLIDHPEWGQVLMAGPDALGRLAGADWGERLPAAARLRLRQWALAASAICLDGDSELDDEGGAAFDEDELADEDGALAVGDMALAPAALPPGIGAASELLSAREWEVLARIAAGDSNKLIARALALSPHTVKRHVANILDKLGCSSRGQAAAWMRSR